MVSKSYEEYIEDIIAIYKKYVNISKKLIKALKIKRIKLKMKYLILWLLERQKAENQLLLMHTLKKKFCQWMLGNAQAPL